MLTKLRIKNFKGIREASLELGRSVVLIGPNNSGKTTALQALGLWQLAVARWQERREGKRSPQKRPGVTINRRDVHSIPIPEANLLWRNLQTHQQLQEGEKRKTAPVYMEVEVDGIGDEGPWNCGFEYYYANPESFYCRPLAKSEATQREVSREAGAVRIAFLPPMSGLDDREFLKQPGEVSLLIGQGRTAEVLRNLCYRLAEWSAEVGAIGPRPWEKVTSIIGQFFGIQLQRPSFFPERGELTLVYKDSHGNLLDISAAGRGLQQTLLLLCHLFSHPGSVLLLDEPDAHLEILRQRQTYNLLSRTAQEMGSQIIAASHSEVVLNEAAGRDQVIAFVGEPHTLADRQGSQVLKALREIGFQDYLLAQQRGWVLYLEDSSDLRILHTFAERLGHRASRLLDACFVVYVGTNLPEKARSHFYWLREAYPQLMGVALFDRLDKQLVDSGPLAETMWERREIENYLLSEDVLLRYAAHGLASDDLMDQATRLLQEDAMRRSIEEVAAALRTFRDAEPWDPSIKATDDFLDPLFKTYFRHLDLPLLLRKAEYFRLAQLVPPESIDPEVVQKLDLIEQTAGRATPWGEPATTN